MAKILVGNRLIDIDQAQTVTYTERIGPAGGSGPVVASECEICFSGHHCIMFYGHEADIVWTAAKAFATQDLSKIIPMVDRGPMNETFPPKR